MRLENSSRKLLCGHECRVPIGVVAVIIFAFGVVGAARAATLTIDLPEAPTVQRHIAHFQCDAAATAFGLPAGTFASNT